MEEVLQIKVKDDTIFQLATGLVLKKSDYDKNPGSGGGIVINMGNVNSDVLRMHGLSKVQILALNKGQWDKPASTKLA